MSRDMRKTVFWVSGQVRHKPSVLSKKKARILKFGCKYEGRSESSNNCLVDHIIFIIKQKETYLF